MNSYNVRPWKEAGKIVRQWAVRSKSLHELRGELVKHYESYAALGLTPPKCIYVDNVEEVEKLLMECYPSIRKENGGYGAGAYMRSTFQLKLSKHFH